MDGLKLRARRNPDARGIDSTSDQITPEALFGQRVDRHMDACPPSVPQRASCAQALEVFRARPESSLLIVDATHRPCGILTARDVVRRVALQSDPEVPVASLMTSPIATIRDDDYLFHGIGIMRRHGYRHLPVVDAGGRLQGMLYLDRALSSPLRPSLELIERLTHEGDIDGLGDVRAAQVDLARHMLAERAEAGEVQSLLALVTRDIYRRLLERVRVGMLDDGWGEPPVDYEFAVMGSLGREESLLCPDQDNALLLADYPDDRHAAVDTWFREYSERVNRALDRIGLPYCDGEIMARNPLWRKSLGQWKLQCNGWLNRPETTAVRCIEILADLRAVADAGRMTADLRASLFRVLPARHAFLQACHRLQQRYPLALSRAGRWRLRRIPASLSGELDLKHLALLPLVSAVRLLTLRAGIDARTTDERLRALAAADILGADEVEELRLARGHFTRLILEQELAAETIDRRSEGQVRLGRISRPDKRRLARGLATVEALRQRVHNELTAEIF